MSSMLTTGSNNMIDSFGTLSDIEDKLNDPIIKKLYDNLCEVNYHIGPMVQLNNKSSFSMSKFISNKLYQKVLERHNTKTIKWRVDGQQSHVDCILHLYLKDNEKEPNIELLIKAISFMASFSNRNRKMTIKFAPLPDKKIISKKQQYFGPHSVNSASISYTETEMTINIYREEEAIKVLFHEIIHGLLFSSLDNYKEKVTERLCHKYNLNPKLILINESYTEIWAKIMNCFFISTLASSNNYQHFCTMLSIESDFSYSQGRKIHHYAQNMSDIDCDTNVSAYYLVVPEIFKRLPEFIKMCSFHPRVQDNDKCIDFIYHLDKIEHKKNTGEFQDTMRMSVMELKI